MRTLWIVLRKDLLVEGRTRDLLPAMGLLALLLIVLTGSSGLRGEAAAAVLWVAVVVSAASGLARSFAHETDQEQVQGLRLAPVDPALIYLGKAGANLILVLAVEAFALAASVIFLDLPVSGRLAPLAAILVLGTAGIVVLGTLFGAMLSAVRLREALLPVLLLPVSAPVVMAASGATAKLIAPVPQPVVSEAVLLAAFTVGFTAIAMLVFESLVAD